MALRQTRVDIDASGFERGFGEATKTIERSVERDVVRAGMSAARASQVAVPVDEAQLKASMTTKARRTRRSVSKKTGAVRGDNFVFEIRYSDEAAWYQELGTRDHAAQPFLRPAIQQAARDLGR